MSEQSRRKTILRFFRNYTEPVWIQDFVRKHLVDLGLEDNARGRNIIISYISYLVRTGDLVKTHKGSRAHVSLAKNYSDYMLDSVWSDLSSKSKKIITCLLRYRRPIALAKFIDQHLQELGQPVIGKSRSSLRIYIYRMISLGLLSKQKRGRFTSIQINKQLYKELKEHIPDHTKPPLKPSLKRLIETISLLKLEDERLDTEIEQIVDKQKQLKAELNSLYSLITTQQFGL